MNFLEGQNYIKKKEFGKALNFFLKLEKEKIQDDKIFFYLGIIYFEINEFEKSILNYERYLDNFPNSRNALYNLAIVNYSAGNLKLAKNIFHKLIQLNKKDIGAYYGLYNVDPNSLTNENYKNLLKLKKNDNLSLYDKGIIGFLLSIKDKKDKKFKNEIEQLDNSHINIYNSNYQYNTSSQFYYNKIINKHFDKVKILKQNNSKFELSQINPIFIIGLPRSGSTLIESILTSGVKKIHSLGECHIFNVSIINQIGSKIYYKNFDPNKFNFSIDKKILCEDIYDKYFTYFGDESIQNKFVLDKSLENFFNIEIIFNIFPKAKFLHTYRNPKDAVVSIYQSMLPELSWTHNINDILKYIDDYLKVVNYFKNKYPNLILDINLEKFTENTEKFSKVFYEFCDLSWNKETLNYYKRKDLFTKTLSSNQIRTKVKTYEYNKYKPYYFIFEKYKKKYKWLND